MWSQGVLSFHNARPQGRTDDKKVEKQKIFITSNKSNLLISYLIIIL